MLDIMDCLENYVQVRSWGRWGARRALSEQRRSAAEHPASWFDLWTSRGRPGRSPVSVLRQPSPTHTHTYTATSNSDRSQSMGGK